MKKGCAVLALVLALVLVAAWGVWRFTRGLPRKARRILREAEVVQVFSLDPEGKSTQTFHYWAVLGDVALRGKAGRALSEAVLRGVTYSSMHAGCFNPRHAVRATSKEGTVDLVICLECANVELYFPPDNSRAPNGGVAANWLLGEELTKTLQRAGIKVLPDPWEEEARRNKREHTGK